MFIEKGTLVFHECFKDEVFKTLEYCNDALNHSVNIECVSEGEYHKTGECDARSIFFLKKVLFSDFHRMNSNLSKRLFFKQFKLEIKKSEDILSDWI